MARNDKIDINGEAPERWPHLHPLAATVMGKGTAARLQFLKSDRWIGYLGAENILADLQELVDLPDLTRPPCRLIVGPADNGKTHILRRFEKKNPRTPLPDGSGTHVPVLFLSSPNKPNVDLLYAEILRRVGTPVPPSDNTRRLMSRLQVILPRVDLRVLLIDEFHSSIQGSKKATHEYLQAIKALSNDFNLSIIGAGTISADAAIRTDDQLNTRFERHWLPRWREDGEFRSFLASMEQVLPLEHPSNLSLGTLPSKLLAMADGRIGQVIKLLKKASAHAIKTRAERIDLEIIRSCGFKTIASQGDIPEGVA